MVARCIVEVQYNSKGGYKNVFFFLFQAEDGIRYLVRSRGLGDVYKRQGPSAAADVRRDGIDICRHHVRFDFVPVDVPGRLGMVHRVDHAKPVSYTHLTLPTSDLV